MQLIKYPNSILNQISLEITKADLDKVKASIPDMTAIMKVNNGVGIAAVQVGILQRYALLDMTKDPYRASTHPDILVMINPQIIDEKNKVKVSESCLSLPRFHEITLRPSEVTVSYRDLNFEEKTISLAGIMAQCVSHEIEHFNGILQLDKVSKMKRDMYLKALKKRDLL